MCFHASRLSNLLRGGQFQSERSSGILLVASLQGGLGLDRVVFSKEARTHNGGLANLRASWLGEGGIPIAAVFAGPGLSLLDQFRHDFYERPQALADFFIERTRNQLLRDDLEILILVDGVRYFEAKNDAALGRIVIDLQTNLSL